MHTHLEVALFLGIGVVVSPSFGGAHRLELKHGGCDAGASGLVYVRKHSQRVGEAAVTRPKRRTDRLSTVGRLEAVQDVALSFVLEADS